MEGLRDPETESRMVSPAEVARLRFETAAVVAAWLQSQPWAPQFSPAHVEAELAAFEAAYAGRPVADNAGGSRYNVCLWLWVLARLLAPGTIVESGTHRGQTAWLFRQARPDAAITTFDISHDQLAHREPSIRYVAADWLTEPVSVPPGAPALAFFDDHVSQVARLTQAHARGFRWLIFDDNVAAWQLHATGVPPAPTLAMLFDDGLADGQRIDWLRKGKPHSLTIDRTGWAQARALIAGWGVVPELLPVNCYRGQFGLTLVNLHGR